MSENMITIDYNPYLLKLKILNNGIENKAMFLDDFQNIQMNENLFYELLMRLTKRRESLKILFVAHEQYSGSFDIAKEKIQKETKKTIEVHKNTYSDEKHREKIQKISEDSLLENLDLAIKDTITRLHDGNLESIPEDLRKLRLDVLKSEKFAENDERYIEQMRKQDSLQKTLSAIDFKIEKLDKVREDASIGTSSLTVTVKTNSLDKIRTSLRYESKRYEKLLNDFEQLDQKKYLPVCTSDTVDTADTSNRTTTIKKMIQDMTNTSFFSKDDQKDLENKLKLQFEDYENISNRALKLQSEKVQQKAKEEKKIKKINDQIEKSKKLQEFRIKLLQLCTESE